VEQGGRGSVIGIATRYELNNPGLESLSGENFRTHPDMPRGPTSSLRDGHRVSFIVPKGASIKYIIGHPHPSSAEAVYG